MIFVSYKTEDCHGFQLPNEIEFSRDRYVNQRLMELHKKFGFDIVRPQARLQYLTEALQLRFYSRPWGMFNKDMCGPYSEYRRALLCAIELEEQMGDLYLHVRPKMTRTDINNCRTWMTIRPASGEEASEETAQAIVDMINELGGKAALFVRNEDQAVHQEETLTTTTLSF